MNAPIDQASRERFVSELDKNFSVVAAAGSGKTSAITDRIVEIARSDQAHETLPQLVVVAFTNRAADEMQQRTRAEILRAGVPLDVLSAFNRAFFGTIHSFCVRLLETYGHRLGLPPQFDLVTVDDELWNEFVQQQTTIGRSLSEENRRELLRHVQVRRLMELGRRGELNAVDPPVEKCPDADFSAIYRYVAKGPTLQTVPSFQKELRRAEQIWRETQDFVRWPICNSRARDFVPIKREAFGPMRRWLDQASLCVAAEVQRDYREFRLERGMLTYDDQVALALQLLQHPDVAREIRAKDFRVLLDEAQDTDPRQFSLLLEITRPPDAAEVWLEDRQSPPRPGHFCMVGDFQQSIYRDRADLSQYRRIHERLVEANAAEAVEFSVTFRLDITQLELVNQTFQEILNNIDNQVEFVELSPRPQILPGQVVRLNLKPGNLSPDARGKVSDARKAAEEARQLAQWLRAAGLAKLRAQSWRDVAILCPRKEWLQTLRRGLREAGFTVQVQSEKESKGDSPAYAWFTALFVIMSQPCCGYEIVGVLREVFGISDHDLALFSRGYGDRFQIETLTNGADIVSRKLSLLAQIRLSILPLPLFDAADELVRQTRLRERLRALPAEDFENLEGELDALLALAATSEAERMTLGEFAELLRMHFADEREIRPSSEKAIQLITSQKAKGSEWQAVIIPFLAREVRSASPRYPCVFKNRQTGEMTLLWDDFDRAEIKELLDRDERQEMERLLYVALTRAQHTLVLAFDEELFAKTNGEVHKDSQIKWLRCDSGGCNEKILAGLLTEARECPTTAGHQKKSRAKIDTEKILKAPVFPRVSLEKARKQASNFVHTLNPSGLGTDEEPPAKIGADARTDANNRFRLRAAATAATRYGLWWHDFIQQIPWKADAGWREKIFETNRPMSPDMARSTREWRLLQNHLSSSSDFRRRLIDRQFLVHAEMPFYWRIAEEACLEGIIDLAFFDSTAQKWLIIDWKTNRVPRDKIDNLRTQYRSQISAYWKAVTQMTGASVDAGIYSTSTGQFIGYDPDDLGREWERLRTLPPEKIATEIAVDHEGPPVQLEFSGLSDRVRHG